MLVNTETKLKVVYSCIAFFSPVWVFSLLLELKIDYVSQSNSFSVRTEVLIWDCKDPSRPPRGGSKSQSGKPRWKTSSWHNISSWKPLYHRSLSRNDFLNLNCFLDLFQQAKGGQKYKEDTLEKQLNILTDFMPLISFCTPWKHQKPPNHIETSPLICRTNQWTGFYMIRRFSNVFRGCRRKSVASNGLIKFMEPLSRSFYTKHHDKFVLRHWHSFKDNIGKESSSEMYLSYLYFHFSSAQLCVYYLRCIWITVIFWRKNLSDQMGSSYSMQELY